MDYACELPDLLRLVQQISDVGILGDLPTKRRVDAPSQPVYFHLFLKALCEVFDHLLSVGGDMATPLASNEELLPEKLGDYRPNDLTAGSLCMVRGSLTLLKAAILSSQASHPNRMAPGDVKVPNNGGCLDIKPVGVPGSILARDARLNVVCERGTLYYAAVLKVSREAGNEDIGGNPCDGRHLGELIKASSFQFNIDSPNHPEFKKLNVN